MYLNNSDKEQRKSFMVLLTATIISLLAAWVTDVKYVGLYLLGSSIIVFVTHLLCDLSISYREKKRKKKNEG